MFPFIKTCMVFILEYFYLCFFFNLRKLKNRNPETIWIKKSTYETIFYYANQNIKIQKIVWLRKEIKHENSGKIFRFRWVWNFGKITMCGYNFSG